MISIAAGIPIKKLESYVYSDGDPSRKNMPILRVMLQYAGFGACRGAVDCAAMHLRFRKTWMLPEKILSAMGTVFKCEEKEMDAVTAVSGSGPAYCFIWQKQ
ncbi:MAG: hypothetical protein R2860_08980 [Desulfobacterales bacterium]